MQATYELAMAAGRDAANKQAQSAGRKAWNEDDWNLMCQTFSCLMPEPAKAAQD